jgi:hypothetical protein
MKGKLVGYQNYPNIDDILAMKKEVNLRTFVKI